MCIYKPWHDNAASRIDKLSARVFVPKLFCAANIFNHTSVCGNTTVLDQPVLRASCDQPSVTDKQHNEKPSFFSHKLRNQVTASEVSLLTVF
jgi:hypothetical protein